MKKVNRISICLIVLILAVQYFPHESQVYGMATESGSEKVEKIIVDDGIDNPVQEETEFPNEIATKEASPSDINELEKDSEVVLKDAKSSLFANVGPRVSNKGSQTLTEEQTILLDNENNTLSKVNESATSKLGHLKNSRVKIYESLDKDSSLNLAGDTYTNAVYYIKKQAEVSGQTYYLISKQPSSTRGVVGWVKASDISTHSHVSVDKKTKTFYIRGTGKAYTKAWGGSKDFVYDLSKYKYNKFTVQLTEKVGNNFWYRGTLNGKTVWVHTSYLTPKEEKSTSRLGQLKNSNVVIYKNLHNQNSGVKAGKTYTNKVYYIKKEAKINDITYYLISNNPSSTKGVVGWVKASDLSTHSHVGVDKKTKTFYIKGTGKAYTKAWGGSKDLVYNLSQHKGKEFKVNLTEKVGNNVWYRGKLNGKTVWVHNSYLYENKHSYYDLELNEALKIQETANPQTDKEYKTYISKEYVKDSKVTADVLNVRGGPSTDSWVVGRLSQGATVKILAEVNGWYEIEYTDNHRWVNASPDDILYYLNPLNFIKSSVQQLQFLDLTKTSGIDVSVLNDYLKGKGILEGQGQAFLDASKKFGLNETYLVSHAVLETGNGDSTLAKGVKHNGKTVYNMYGIGAYDECPVECGARKAYDEGWDTPYKAIVGGAAFIDTGYIKAGQNTLYKMRWNPQSMALTGTFGKQYATDIGWAYKQAQIMYNNFYKHNQYTLLQLDIPVYK